MRQYEEIEYRNYESLNELVEANKNRLFIAFPYKRLFTPYEQNEKFMDESEFNGGCKGRIVSLLSLPDGDILIGIQGKEEWDDYNSCLVEFFKLSEIRLNMCVDSLDEYEDD